MTQLAEAVSQAVERVRRVKSGVDAVSVYCPNENYNCAHEYNAIVIVAHNHYREDLDLLASAYIAQRAADGEPVTEEFALSLGFVHKPNVKDEYLLPCEEGILVELYHFTRIGGGWQLRINKSDAETWKLIAAATVNLSTRSDVRQLLAALRIPTKETP